MKEILLGILLLIVLAVVADGQIASASLQGEVSDQLAARLPGVKVTAQHEGTGFSRSVVTGDDGSYRIDELLPGRYNISAEKNGPTPRLVIGWTQLLFAACPWTGAT